MTADIYTDGASRGNPGESAISFLIKKSKSIHVFSRVIGVHTNNEAEYLALIEALDYACRNGIKNIRIFSDSELLVKQLTGEYKIKSDKLKPLQRKVIESLNGHFTYAIKHVDRENKFIRIVDKLCNLALDTLLNVP